MRPLRVLAAYALIASAASSPLFAGTVSEIEPNEGKLAATLAVLKCNDSICGSSLGTATTPGATSVDYWRIRAFDPANLPGMYRWQLTVVTPLAPATANTLMIRGLDNAGIPGCGTPNGPASTTDVVVQSSADVLANYVQWYSTNAPSTVYVSVIGAATATAGYTAVLTCTPVTTPSLGSFASGPITVSAGLTLGPVSNTELEIWTLAGPMTGSGAGDGFHNDDPCGAPPFGTFSSLTRGYVPGTYYVMLGSSQTNSDMVHPDDDLIGETGWLMDFPNAIVNGDPFVGSAFFLAVGDHVSEANAVSESHGSAFEIDIYCFDVLNLRSFCFGDGGTVIGSPGIVCTSCPCSNDSTAGSGTGCRNSSGAAIGAELLARGTPTPGPPDNLHFDVIGAPANVPCLLFSGEDPLPNNPLNACYQSAPGSGVGAASLNGLRCVGTNVKRHGARFTNAVGTTTQGWGPPDNPDDGILDTSGYVVGQTRYFQAWFRDLDFGTCITGANTTQGVAVTVLP